jgi:xanthine dehydrogenase/oxidase
MDFFSQKFVIVYHLSSYRHYGVNACLMPVCAADGCHVTTVEGVGQSIPHNIGGSGSGVMHPIQDRMTNLHGSQCGYCTPGIVVALYALFANDAEHPVKSHQVEEHLDGNLCRCTGYRPIWDAARSLCSDTGGASNNDNEAHGPCGLACKDCPTRHDCDMPCNTHTTTNGDIEDSSSSEEKKDETPPNAVAETKDGKWKQMTTSSQDKFGSSQFRDGLCDLKTPSGARFSEQPNVMFPAELREKHCTSVMVVGSTATWFTPSTLQELSQLVDQFPNAKIVVGATEVGIETKFKHAVYPRLIYPSHSIDELQAFDSGEDELVVGACLPLSTIQHECGRLAENGSGGKIRTFQAIHDMLRWFASTQIRNAACLGGNLATASPISDMNPMLAAMGASLKLQSATNGVRMVKVSDFFLSYRQVDLKPSEVIVSIHAPQSGNYFDYILPFKQARRREDDISIATAGIHMKVKPSEDASGFVITEASLAFGGMAPKTAMCPKTSASLVGQIWSADTFAQARRVLMDELYLPEDVPGGQTEYRRTLAASFLFKFYLATTVEIAKDVERLAAMLQCGGEGEYKMPLPAPPMLDDSDVSGAEQFVSRRKPAIEGTQVYPHPKVTPGLEDNAAADLPVLPSPTVSSAKDKLGIPATHASGALHTTGEAIYVDDMPQPNNLLHSVLVISDRCNVTLQSVDKTRALQIPGVVNVFFHDDLAALGGSNKLGPILKDEEVFATKEIRHVGMVIGIAVAETMEAAQQATRAVDITYADILDEAGTPLKPIISMQEAIEANSFYDFTNHTLLMGKIDEDLKIATDNPDNTIQVSGEFAVGGQEHFYLEVNSSLVVPEETGLKVYASTQAPTKTQMFCASATNTPASKVVCHVKRMGGGFGGKETRSVFASAAAAVAAKITRRPVRLTLDRNVDMAITGQRHAFKAKYTATASYDPQDPSQPPTLGGLDVQIYSNGGCSLDLSLPILDRCLFHIDNVYKWKSLRANGLVCKTNQPPHTAFRGFGGPQGLAICETIMDHLVAALPKSHQSLTASDQFRKANMYSEGDYVPFGMALENWNIPKAWDMLYESAQVSQRRQAIAEFNAQHKWKKRGLAILPTKFGIAFTAKFMNQGGALVHLYQDGTVLISHGGTEMGQGLHTKCAQVAAHAFEIPLSQVFIDDSSTDKVANTNPTAASQGTDLYGMATLIACREILQNIQPMREKLKPNATLAEVATAAFFERIDLTAHGFYKVADERCGYDWDSPTPTDPEILKLPDNSWRGHAFNYFTQAVAVSEVEIDVLSGDHRTLRADIMADVGSSINPALDIGQIEGAFIQGMGWSTMEEITWGDDEHTWVKPKGRLFTQGPGTYKIPAFNDCPESFNVTLMDTANPFAVHSSRAVGEPPFFLGASVAFALKDAVRAARATTLGDASKDTDFCMNLPATSERVRMLCGDTIAQEGILKLSVDAGKEEKDAKIRCFQPKGSY